MPIETYQISPAVEFIDVVAPHLRQTVHAWVSGHDRVLISRQSPKPDEFAGNSAYVRAYALLPSHKLTRWLIPLKAGPSTVNSLQIYTPIAWRGRLIKTVLLAVAKAGCLGWISDKIWIKSDGPLALESWARDHIGGRQPIFALSLGAGGWQRKLTIQVMDRTGAIFGYIKLPLESLATYRVRHEAEVLKRLQNTVLVSQVPRVLHAGEWGEKYLLFQSSGPAQNAPLEFGSLHEVLLRKMWSLEATAKPGSRVVEEVATSWERAGSLLGRELQVLGERALLFCRRELRGTTVDCGLMHGDFAPWNLRQQDGELFLFDWEVAEWDRPNLWDIFHFDTQKRVLLKTKSRLVPLLEGSAEARPLYLLYLLYSICSSLTEVEPASPQITMRQRMLAEQLP
jgi:hypothetical protein